MVVIAKDRSPLGADHLTLEGGGGGWFWKRISCKSLSEEKIACSTNVIESLWGKKGKKTSCPPTRLLEQKILDDQKSPTPPPPSRVKWSAPYKDLSSKILCVVDGLSLSDLDKAAYGGLTRALKYRLIIFTRRSCKQRFLIGLRTLARTFWTLKMAWARNLCTINFLKSYFEM